MKLQAAKRQPNIIERQRAMTLEGKENHYDFN